MIVAEVVNQLGDRSRRRRGPQARAADTGPDDRGNRHRRAPSLFTVNPADYIGLEKLVDVVPVTRPVPHEQKR
jgi:hypothetical protein